MVENPEATDEELMVRVQEGDVAAFEALYDRYHRRLFQFVFRLVGEKTLAEDILQEAFLRVFRQRKAYKKSGRFSTYLFAIGRNLCLDALKAWERRHLLADEEDRIEKAMNHTKGPREILQEKEVGRVLQREIRALPEDQREVLLLSRYSGLSYQEIAEITGTTPAAVKQKAYRALSWLRRRMKDLAE